MDKPSPEILAALQIRIAELMGWKFLRLSTYRDKRPVYTHPQTGLSTTELPDFTGSLDAIHEAWKALPYDPKFRFDKELSRVLVDFFDASNWLVNAEAWQRAIALDRTLSPEPII